MQIEDLVELLNTLKEKDCVIMFEAGMQINRFMMDASYRFVKFWEKTHS